MSDQRSTLPDSPNLEWLRKQAKTRLAELMTLAEFDSALRGHRPPNVGVMDLMAALALRHWEHASAVVAANQKVIDHGGALHLLARRGDATGAKWLLDHGANPDAMWAHWDADVTALHLCALSGTTDVARVLLDAGANPRIRDSKHSPDAFGWAGFFKREELVQLLHERGNR